MISNLYAVRNLLSGLVDQVYVICNDTVASVELPVPYARRSPLDEWQLVKIGEINLDSGSITPVPMTIVPWDTRRLPSVEEN